MARILDWDHLSPPEQEDAVALDLADNDPPRPRRLIAQLRRDGYPFAPYLGVFAVEDGRVLARVIVVRPRLSIGRRSEPVTGIQDVVTRADRSGEGLASRLLDEVHQRERSAGIRWSFLWTRRSWRAHPLYEHLGYRDLYCPSAAYRPPFGSSVPELRPGYRERAMSPGETGLVGELLERSRSARDGFRPRAPGLLRVALRARWISARNVRLLYWKGALVGYATAAKSLGGVVSREVVVTSPRHAPAMIDLLERAARGGAVGLIRTTFIADEHRLLERRGYRFVPEIYTTLMARPLGRVSRDERAAMFAAFSRPTVSVHDGDLF